jgi:hypothetical protein
MPGGLEDPQYFNVTLFRKSMNIRHFNQKLSPAGIPAGLIINFHIPLNA